MRKRGKESRVCIAKSGKRGEKIHRARQEQKKRQRRKKTIKENSERRRRKDCRV